LTFGFLGIGWGGGWEICGFSFEGGSHGGAWTEEKKAKGMQFGRIESVQRELMVLGWVYVRELEGQTREYLTSRST
jgi:hypothetical protein